MSLILKYDLGNPHRLPVGYTPLAYIECTGTLWIDTGWKPGSSNIRVIIKAELEKQSSQLSTERGLFGNYSAGKGIAVGYYGMYWYSGLNCSGTWRNVNVTGGIKSLNATFDFITNSTKTEFRVDDGYNSSTSYVYSNASNEASPDNCYLGKPRSENNGVPWLGKIYYCIINDNNVKVKELVPAKRNSDGVIGMFDIVSQTFKTNAGTGTFIAGPEVVVLPYEYLLVEYLHATGSQWFDTGIKIFHKTTYSTFEISSLFSVDSIHNYDLLWGTPGHADRYEQWINSGATFYNRLANTYSTHSSMTANTMINYTCAGNVSNSLFVTTVNGSSVTKSYSPEDWNYNLYFLKSDYLFTGKVFNFKMTGNGTLIRNFIPCYRRSDLKPGMYDTINNVFYTNAGSGEFILGPVVEESSRQLEYNNAGSNYIGKPTNVHHSTSNPSTTQINEGSGDFSGGATIRTTIPALNNSYSISWWANGVYGGKMMWSIGNLNPLYNLCLNSGDSNEDPWYRPGTTAQITAPSNNVWHHFVVTGDGSSNKLYVDGVHYGTAKTYKSCTGSALGLNYYAGYAAYQWNGKMYDFRIYNNVLTANEVLQIYKGGL